MSAGITLTGRLVADPELRFGANGNAVLNLRVVTSGRRKTDEGWVDVDTTFWSVSAFRQLAENAAKSRDWEDKEGNKRTSWEVAADHIGVDLVRTTTKTNQVARSSTADDAWVSDAAPF
jgi:single-strand DNA-binding protein